jgi:acetyl esterase
MRLLAAVSLLFVSVACTSAQSLPAVQIEPRVEQLQSLDGAPLEAHVFDPGPSTEPRPAIVIFHGGGWYMGDPTWAYSRAQRYAERDLVAIAAQYRLSDQKTVTPIDAMVDARAQIRWVRANAARLNVDPTRIAAFGWSAGGHLAVAAAQAGDASSRPDALVLLSPAVDLERDDWFARLVGPERDVAAYSPLRQIQSGMPPALILQGDVDTVTPMSGAQGFCAAMEAAGNSCELEIYRGYGHLFTPAGKDDSGLPEPDSATSAAADERADRFLRERGFLK